MLKSVKINMKVVKNVETNHYQSLKITTNFKNNIQAISKFTGYH